MMRVHLDCELKPRAIHVCKPKEECVDRHAAVVKELRARAKEAKGEEDAANNRTALEKKRREEANGSSSGAVAAAKIFGTPSAHQPRARLAAEGLGGQGAPVGPRNDPRGAQGGAARAGA